MEQNVTASTTSIQARTIQQMENEVKILRQQAKRLEKENQYLKEENTRITKEKEKEQEALGVIHKRLNQSISSMKNLNDSSALAKIQELENELLMRDSFVKECEEENQKLEAKYSKAEKLLELMTAKIEALKKEKEELSKTVDTTKKVLEEKSQEFEKVSKEKQDALNELREARREIVLLKDREEQGNSKIKELEAELQLQVRRS
eukprot:TRINITY_DN7283_c0_g1_i3.p2 TRINITY_DN7283_c0_g1~~TRINITY_DN7283_c0_g1_i3.p2  ORF type:complete len:205 (-),score=64.13 TRINITY_DN7283_c0_g1_i3:1365-1979(-)